MSLLGNILWLVFGGFVAGIAWWATGLVALISIIGIPWARSCFVIGQMSFVPFGKEIIARDILTEKEDIGTSGAGLIGNIVWFILAGWWLAIGHLVIAVAQAITIIGIPFALQHIKLAAVSLAPVGKTVVDKYVAAAAYERKGTKELEQIRR